ncbi:hypothetical protein LTR10_018075 [Elasticomyces elasticus]|uniref:DUF4045 domain-containing protein n=1 Tax=Exophiala sideris TaxID=1016849 RepID=A0ABR0JPL2_9EURO|nr:hypothetical protein LTR10_018075 [Elasticomyces elasticus]KAK5039522.1 hypothetical protein LTS07_000016 [Exophiala sideris]KAK5041075.1 hypothetical protein LTR13_002549 [Exophiala sideris]KAK5067899.1 hypothetical protein LTR69_000016 [Exophiala sideris]KAK5187201.1 hypothetical protein LTR44_000016 [Eurotiomycetes sp. CCFEE 6388]
MPPNASNLQPPSAQARLVPNLTYRNASPEKEPGPLRDISNLTNDTVTENAKGKGKEPEVGGDDIASGQEKPRLTIKQLREQAQNAVQAQQEEEEQPTSPPPQQKKRSSIFGSLFQVKEPTQVALNQVAAQMKAQHGSTNPTKVPNVRMEKMPEYVPKVNTKWDGIPDSVKKVEKEKKAREKGQASTDYPVYQNRGRGQLNSRNSSSSAGSFGSRGRSSGSYSNSTRPHFYAHSVNSSGDLASQQRTDRPPQRAASLHSQTASNTSEASFPEASPEIPRLTGLTRIDEPPSPKSRPSPGIDALPACSASQPAIPQDTSSLTPSQWQVLDAHSQQESESSRRDSVTLTSSGPGVLGPPAASKSTRRSVASGFLSGEARELVVSNDEDDDNGEPPKSDLPLRNKDTGGHSPATPSLADSWKSSPQKRSDDTRTRLGLRLKDDDTPRDNKKSPVGSPRHAPESGVSSPRTKLSKSFSLLGKGKEKKAT